MRSPFNFSQFTSFLDNKIKEASVAFSVLTSNLMQQQNPSQTNTPPSAHESMATRAVATSLARRSSEPKQPTQASTSAQSTSSAQSTPSGVGVARFGPRAQEKETQMTSAPARPAPAPAQVQAQSAPASDQNLGEATGVNIGKLIGFFSNLANPKGAPAPAPAPTRPAPAPAQSAPAPAQSAPAPARLAPPRTSEVPEISPKLEARIFYDKLEREGHGKVDFSLIKQKQGEKLSDHLTTKMNFWKKTLGEKQVNASDISVNPKMQIEDMLLNYAKFLKENIDRTKEALPDKEMGKALITSQEFEMARLRYFVGGLDSLTDSKKAIYEATSEQSRTYASRKNERMRTDLDGRNRENSFISNIQVPKQIEVRALDSSDMGVYKLSILAEQINNLSKSKSRKEEEKPPSPSPIETTSQSFLRTLESLQGLERKKLRENINNKPLAGISQPFESPLIIGEKTLEERMKRIDNLFGDNNKTSNVSNSPNETAKSKENNLIEYVNFLSEKIKLVKKTISSDSTNYDQKFRLQFLQGQMMKEIVKIRAGVFPQRTMSKDEKISEAENLIDSIPSKIVSQEDMNRLINSAQPIDHGRRHGDRIIYSKNTLDMLDGQIKTIVRLVNPLERKLEKTARSGSELGRDPGENWAGIQHRNARKEPGRGGGSGSGRGR